MIITEKTIAAQVYALKQHEYQNYGDGIPYSVHLFMTISCVQKFSHLISDDDLEDVICAMWLHDVMEDGGVSYNDIKMQFVSNVAEIVFSVTDESGRNRQEKALKTYPKIANNRLAVFVKLSDRISNSTYSKLNGHSMFDKYKKEFDYFKNILYTIDEYEPMWVYLERIYNNKPTGVFDKNSA